MTPDRTAEERVCCIAELRSKRNGEDGACPYRKLPNSEGSCRYCSQYEVVVVRVEASLLAMTGLGFPNNFIRN